MVESKDSFLDPQNKGLVSSRRTRRLTSSAQIAQPRWHQPLGIFVTYKPACQAWSWRLNSTHFKTDWVNYSALSGSCNVHQLSGRGKKDTGGEYNVRLATSFPVQWPCEETRIAYLSLVQDWHAPSFTNRVLHSERELTPRLYLTSSSVSRTHFPFSMRKADDPPQSGARLHLTWARGCKQPPNPSTAPVLGWGRNPGWHPRPVGSGGFK